MTFRTFSLSEAADYLHLPPATLEDFARRGEVPCQRQGKRLTFLADELEEWASRRLLGLDDRRLTDFHVRSSARYHDLSPDAAILTKLLKPEWIRPALDCRSKPSVIRAMVDLADSTGLVAYRDELLEGVTEREGLCSTALAGGMAMLHPRVHEPYMFDDSFIVLGRTVADIPFGSPDRSTSDVFFLICCQDDRIHLHVLARLCMICQHTGALTLLRGSDSADEIFRILCDAESQIISAL